ncbi:MFS transporter [Arthrobacter sp. ISL-65]|uniref:MFS transporter n=1 Tax=Arthrobacter sp. ISL-65 TaxID=2819112 RepID=UPI001BE4F338|nr:MFS transporter [Arthrobacter sp. ISL-65]MBT2547314.1 MFS transporter [Arthrobacter sp. ISL-65]
MPYLPETRTLLGAQLVFNLGFYAVVPFLAGAMGRDYALDAAAVGLVLGARTFSQQGMFLFGGLLADRWGARRSILAGCLVRIAGYATLAAASDFTLFLLGAVLTGAGGALFSPALESQLSHADCAHGNGARTGNAGNAKERALGKGRRSVFVWLAITGEMGALAGPLLGASLLGWGFDAALAAGIAIFVAVTVVLWFRLPAGSPGKSKTAGTREPEASPGQSRSALGCLKNRRFVAFCLLASTNMVAYNQLYFAFPLELDRRGLDGSWLAMLFLLASVLTLLLQLPVAAAGQRLGPGRAMSAGFLLVAAALAAAALTSVQAEAGGSGAGRSGVGGTVPTGPAEAGSVALMAGIVGALILGHMLLTPTILSLIPRFIAPEGPASGRGAYYGLSATCGGIAVLAGNALLGWLLDLTDRNHWWPGTPWLPMVGLAVLAALMLPRLLRGIHRTSTLGTAAVGASIPN